MGHLAGKELYKKLQSKLDGYTVRTPWNQALYDLLRQLYTEDEALLVVRMPYRPSGLDRVARVVGMDETRVRVLLDGLCEKGLVLDLWNGSRYDYFVSPMVIGIFEFTMMRTGGLDLAAASRLFRDYMFGDDSFFRKNFSRGETVSPMRAFPRGESVAPGDYAEVLDFEKAEHIISSSEKFAMGICSCRHEKLHLDEYRCGTPLETCSSLNGTAEYLIRHNLAREVTRSEMMDNLARSRDLGLVVTGDVTKRDVGFLCHCCGCCCNLLLGLSRFGYQGTVVTSGFIAAVEPFCNGCGRCVKACPVKAISLLTEDMGTCSKRSAVVDETICIGCGVCSASCARKALLLRKRKQRVYLPEDTLERVMMACLERGTLQNLVFDDPGRISQAFLRSFLGAFFRLSPVKKALVSETFRSRFLAALR